MDLPVVDLLNDRAVSDAALWTGDAPIFFGCEAGGAVRIELRGELTSSTNSSRPPLQLLLLTHAQMRALTESYQEYLVFEPRRERVCHFDSLFRRDLPNGVSVSVATRCPARAQVTAAVVDCAFRRQRLTGRVEFENPGGDQLGLGRRYMPEVLFVVAAMHLCFLVPWLATLVRFRRSVSVVHALMALAFTARGLEALMQAQLQSLVRRDGVTSIARGRTTRLADDVAMVLSLVVLIVLGRGWFAIRRGMTSTEAYAMSFFTFMFFLLGALSFGCDTNDECSFVQLLRFLAVVMTLVAVLVAVHCSLTDVRGAIADEAWSEETCKMYALKRLFLRFRLYVLAYALLPTAFLILGDAAFSWQHEWALVLSRRLTLLLLDATLLFRYAPLPEVKLFFR